MALSPPSATAENSFPHQVFHHCALIVDVILSKPVLRLIATSIYTGTTLSKTHNQLNGKSLEFSQRFEDETPAAKQVFEKDSITLDE
jgi:hypothetical protein